MNILTPSGYVDISTVHVGDDVCAFDLSTGAPIVNQIEAVEWVNLAEWERWWQGQTVPPFQFYKINGTWVLNSEQSIWRNGTQVCHAKHLVVGDTLYDDHDNPFTITSIEEVTAGGWWRFDISGDHSYIVDGMTLHNASRFWVGGTGTWDLSATTHWASTTGGSSGASAPGSADTCTFDGSSGGGTVTPNYGGTGTFQSITCGAFTGTIDWSTNNNGVTLSSGTGFNGSGTGTRTINLGNGTWTLTTTLASTPWNLATTTGLTFNANSSTILFSGNTAASSIVSFAGGGLTYSTLQVNAAASGGNAAIQGANTFTTLTINGQRTATFNANMTITSMNLNGTSSGQVGIMSTSVSTQRILTITTLSATWAAFRDISASGTATNSFDLGNNSGITITAPSSSGGGLLINPGMTGGCNG